MGRRGTYAVSGKLSIQIIVQDNYPEKIDTDRSGKCHCHHLVEIPVPEEVNWAISSALDNSPASVVYVLFTPDLHWSLCLVWSDQVHAAGDVAGILRL